MGNSSKTINQVALDLAQSSKTPLLFRETREVSGKSSGVFSAHCAAFAWKKAARGGEKSICGGNAHQCGHHM